MGALQEDDFRDFVASRGHALVRTAYLLTGDQQLAEDLVQTALEKAVAHWGSIREVAAAESYVRRTMYREQVSSWRRRQVTERLSPVPPETQTLPSYDNMVANRLDLRDALMQLGTGQRTVLVLRYYEDLTESQVADVLGITVGTVKSQASRALAHLRTARPDLAPSTRGGRHE